MPPTRKLIELLEPTGTVPLCTTVDAPLGPVTVQLIELTCTPPGRVSCIPTDPVLSAGGLAAVPGGVLPGSLAPGEEQPTWPQDAAPAPIAPSSRALRAVVERRIDLIVTSP